jgi:hypothetical protein
VHSQSDARDLSIFRLLGGNGTSEALIFDGGARPSFVTSLPFEI